MTLLSPERLAEIRARLFDGTPSSHIVAQQREDVPALFAHIEATDSTVEPLLTATSRLGAQAHATALRWSSMPDDRPPLTDRQLQVAKLIVDGYTDKQIAAEMGIRHQRVSRIIWQIARRWELDQYRDLRVQIARLAA